MDHGGITLRDRFYGKPLASAAVFLFLFHPNRLSQAAPSQIGLYIAIWATFTGFLFLPRAWWNRRLAAAAVGIVAIECAVAFVCYREIRLLYFVAILLFAAAIRFSLTGSHTPAVAAMAVAALLYVWFGQADLFNLLTFVLLAAMLYFFIRIRMQRKAVHETNKRHLAELRDAYEQLQEASATAIQYAVLEERTRIARDIHDAVGHSLTSLIVQLQAMRYMLKDNPEQAGRTLEEMLGVARRGLQDIRISVHALADDRSVPGMTALKSLLTRMEASASIGYTFRHDVPDGEVSAEAFATLYRVLQESITNVIRHSGATRLEVELGREANGIALRIRDNGVLEAGGKMMEGFGLKVMKARLEASGGSLRYGPAEPNGFELVAIVPGAEAGRRDEAGKET